MTVTEVLDACARRGVVLWVEEDALQVRGPAGSVTPEMEQALRRHKAAVMARLGAGVVSGPSPATAAPPSDLPRPLSIGQQGLWFLHRLEPATLPAYNICKAVDIDGPLDIERWQAAFRQVEIGRAHV